MAVSAGGSEVGFDGSGTEGASELAAETTDGVSDAGPAGTDDDGAGVTGRTGSTRVAGAAPGSSTLADCEVPSLVGAVPSGLSSLVASFGISPEGVSSALGGSSAPGLPCLLSLCLA